MTKEIIIIALVILLTYLYYQQNHPSIDKRSYDDLIGDLKRQVQHYQGLYQKRVEKDLDKKDQVIQTNGVGFWEVNDEGTQTDLSDRKVNNLIGQWNEVAEWATSEGIDVNKKWNLGLLKGKLEQKIKGLEDKLEEKDEKISQNREGRKMLATEFEKIIEKNKREFQISLSEKDLVIKGLKEQVKDKEFNKEEEKILEVLDTEWDDPSTTVKDWENTKEKLEDESRWTQLRYGFENIREKLIQLAHAKIEMLEVRKKMVEMTLEKSQLTQELANSREKIEKLRTSSQEKEEKVKELSASIHQISQDNQKLNGELAAKNNWRDDNLPQLKQELFSQATNTYQELKNQIKVATIAWGRKEVNEKLEELEEFFNKPERERERETINECPEVETENNNDESQNNSPLSRKQKRKLKKDKK